MIQRWAKNVENFGEKSGHHNLSSLVNVEKNVWSKNALARERGDKKIKALMWQRMEIITQCHLGTRGKIVEGEKTRLDCKIATFYFSKANIFTPCLPQFWICELYVLDDAVGLLRLKKRRIEQRKNDKFLARTFFRLDDSRIFLFLGRDSRSWAFSTSLFPYYWFRKSHCTHPYFVRIGLAQGLSIEKWLQFRINWKLQSFLQKESLFPRFSPIWTFPFSVALFESLGTSDPDPDKKGFPRGQFELTLPREKKMCQKCVTLSALRSPTF